MNIALFGTLLFLHSKHFFMHARPNCHRFSILFKMLFSTWVTFFFFFSSIITSPQPPQVHPSFSYLLLFLFHHLFTVYIIILLVWQWNSYTSLTLFLFVCSNQIDSKTKYNYTWFELSSLITHSPYKYQFLCYYYK